MGCLSLFAFLTALNSVHAAVGPVTDLTLIVDTVAPDGAAFAREAIVVQEEPNSVIGPVIVGQKGDNFRLNVINNLDSPNMRQSTSIHWHGIFQGNGQNWADGAAFVNQCPIAPGGDSFLYDFTEPFQTGTFWYHSHLSTQYCDGLRGAFVIYDPLDPYRLLYDVDDESTVITLADWYHSYAEDILIAAGDTILINGHGRFAGAGGTATELSVITVEHGKRYRLRFANIACDPWFAVKIDSHTNLRVIEADGITTVPVTVDSFNIFVGQRYSVILHANQPVGNYWIRAAPNGVSNFAGGIDSAILRYVGAPEEEPNTSEDTPSDTLQEQDLHPLILPGAPGIHSRGAADVVHTVSMEFLTILKCSPTMPVLLQILSGAQTANTLLPAGSFIQASHNDIVELNFPAVNVAAVGGPHPIHLHGHAFDVIRSAGTNSDNWFNPPRRDVVSTGTDPNDNVTIRFRADNPGPWFLHCHIDWHLELGFALVIAEAPSEWDSDINPPAAWDDLCPTFAWLLFYYFKFPHILNFTDMMPCRLSSSNRVKNLNVD
uniref:laccase n=1 Tax=Halocyphina villosa TaxID=175173 RepID=Q1AJM3_9AGAR|nr:laccase [Halocyphina villosa]